jgi:nicotinamidase-related amidase
MKKLFLLLAISPLLLFPLSLNAQEKKATEPIKPALLVIDVQKAFVPMVEEREKEIAVYMINEYIRMFRKNGYPIIFVLHSAEEYGLVPGVPQYEFIDEIPIMEGDIKVTKTYGNAFTKTDLDKILKEKGTNTLFLCGLSSVGCVLATWFGAKDYDYSAFLLKNALMSHDAGYTDQVEIIFGALETEAMEAILR